MWCKSGPLTLGYPRQRNFRKSDLFIVVGRISIRCLNEFDEGKNPVYESKLFQFELVLDDLKQMLSENLHTSKLFQLTFVPGGF